LNRGITYYNLGQYSKAVDDYEKALVYDPNDHMAYYNKGNARLMLKDYKLAIDDYTDAIGVNGKFAKAFYGLGLAYVYSDNPEEGCLALEKAEEMGYAEAAAVIKENCQNIKETIIPD